MTVTIGFRYLPYLPYGYEVHLNSNGMLVRVTERRSSDDAPGLGECVGVLTEYIGTMPAVSSARDLNPLPPD